MKLLFFFYLFVAAFASTVSDVSSDYEMPTVDTSELHGIKKFLVSFTSYYETVTTETITELIHSLAERLRYLETASQDEIDETRAQWAHEYQQISQYTELSISKVTVTTTVERQWKFSVWFKSQKDKLKTKFKNSATKRILDDAKYLLKNRKKVYQLIAEEEVYIKEQVKRDLMSCMMIALFCLSAPFIWLYYFLKEVAHIATARTYATHNFFHFGY